MAKINGEFQPPRSSEAFGARPAQKSSRTAPVRKLKPAVGPEHTAPQKPAAPALKRQPAKPTNVESVPSLSDVSPADVVGLSNMSRSRMMYSLTRIEAELDQMLEEEADPTARAEIELGLQVVTESLRRLSLVQGGADALISK
ncbi:hypothetical protein [Roseibium sp. TrichSKD4]|uniref:hypothetical protein n=1 Tax=Roseibium sp. TrichSKD4 TaxID=744980 RepID=UPI00058BAE65|nr:hypothetical protein [Roseibium sp. TrichSKD4]